MVNQNPQPEVFTTRHSFAGDGATTTQGTSNQQQIYTNQAWNEEIRVYGIMVDMVYYEATTDWAGCENLTEFAQLFDVSIQAGPNNVPMNVFDAAEIMRAEDKILHFSAPVLVLHRQPLQVTVTWRGAAPLADNNDTTVIVSLIGETYIQES